MGDPQGIVTYPGLDTFTKCEYTLSTGISPGTLTIEMPQELLDGIEPTGDVTFTYDDVTITLPNCAVDSAHIAQALGGYIARVFIKDRRYWWSNQHGGGYISGHYNVRMPSGSNADEGFNGQAKAVDGDSTKIRSGTEQAPQDLATLCLQAMGEQNYDVSVLPNDPRPEIDWSYANPAEALQSLCEQLGCRVTYVIDSDSVVIVTIGQGNSLPDNGQQTFISEGANPPQPPSSLMLVGGPTIFQGYLPLEAVGIDKDGSIKPIDKLSYTPLFGWGQTAPIWADFTDPLIRPLVDKIYKMWRLALPIIVPGDNNIEVMDIRQIKLYDRLLDTLADPNDPTKRIPKKPELWGNFETQHKQVAKSQTGQAEPYREFTVDEDRWLIITEDQLLIYDENNEYQPAAVAVKICYSVRDSKTWEASRYTRTRNLSQSSNNTQARILHQEDVFVKIRGTYGQWQTGEDATGNTIPQLNLTGSTDNLESDKIDQEADYYLDAAENEYIEQDSFDIPYAGIVPIQVDGLIHQVTYTIDAGPGGKTMTRASLATEHNPYVLPWAARRRVEREALADKNAKFFKTKNGRDLFSWLSGGF